DSGTDLPGAQTERRGLAGPVRVLLGGETHRPTLLTQSVHPSSSVRCPALYFSDWQRAGTMWSRPLASSCGVRVMSITVEATYENGVLKPAEPLPLNDRAKVRVTIHAEPGALALAYGIIGWTGSAEDLE